MGEIKTIGLERLVAHPDNPNKMSKANFAKLVRNIKMTGKYEPLVVRPMKGRGGYFQIINGHHRAEALRKLGKEKADAVVWDVDDEQVDILLTTLNRLGGRDVLSKKVTLMNRLSSAMGAEELAKLTSHTKKQIERLGDMSLPKVPAKPKAKFLKPIVFFVNEEQDIKIQKAIELAESKNSFKGIPKAERRARSLANIAECFVGEGE